MRCWEAGDAPEMNQEQQAIWFLEKLDKERQGSMLTVLKNNRVAGMGFQAVVDVAYIVAKERMCSTARVAILLTADVRVLAIVPPAPSPPKKKVQLKSRAGSRAKPSRAPISRPPITDANARLCDVQRRAGPCFECGESGHIMRKFLKSSPHSKQDRRDGERLA